MLHHAEFIYKHKHTLAEGGSSPFPTSLRLKYEWLSVSTHSLWGYLWP